MKNHPEYFEKIKMDIMDIFILIIQLGVKIISVFHILNDDNEKIPISYNFKIVKRFKKTRNVKSFFRTSVDSEILNFKNNLYQM